MIKPEVLDSELPHGPWSCLGVDIWAAFCAARDGDVAALRRLLRQDGNLHRAEYGYTQPLHFAVRGGHAGAVRLLLEAGADPDFKEPGGEDLVTAARDRGFQEVADLLETARTSLARAQPATSEEDHPIFEAAASGDVTRVRAFLDEQADLADRADRAGAYPLHRAVAAAEGEVVGLLLDRGADLHARHGAGSASASGYPAVDFQPIDLAMWQGPFWNVRGDLDMVHTLLERGATYDLTIATALGDRNRVTHLLEKNPDCIGGARPCGKRALSTAVEFGHDAIAAILLEKGADPNWPEGDTAPRGVALHAAARIGNQAMVSLLLTHGADPNGYIDASGNAAYVAKTPEIRAQLLRAGATLSAFDLVWLGEDDQVIQRVDANPAWADTGCGGALAAACTLGKNELLERLLAAGARVPPVLTECRSYLLHDPDMLARLLAHGMDPDLPDWQRATPLHVLCSRDSRGRPMRHRQTCAKILLDAGADFCARDDVYRATPLAWAARNDLLDMVRFLLGRGTPVTLPDDEPWTTPLAWAMRRDNNLIATVLCE